MRSTLSGFSGSAVRSRAVMNSTLCTERLTASARSRCSAASFVWMAMT